MKGVKCKNKQKKSHIGVYLRIVEVGLADLFANGYKKTLCDSIVCGYFGIYEKYVSSAGGVVFILRLAIAQVFRLLCRLEWC